MPREDDGIRDYRCRTIRLNPIVQLRYAPLPFIGAIAVHYWFVLIDEASGEAHRWASELGYIVRQAPFQKAHLVDEDYEVDFSTVTTPSDKVAVIATRPLTDNEVWALMAPGELLMFRDGEPQPAAR